MTIVALVSDLAMQSQLSGAADRAGVIVEKVSSADALLAKIAVGPARLVIVDLSHPGLDPAQLMPAIKAHLPSDATLVAFGPHVHKSRLEAAVEAGCDVVISRGQFHAGMEEILRQYGGR